MEIRRQWKRSLKKISSTQEFFEVLLNLFNFYFEITLESSLYQSYKNSTKGPHRSFTEHPLMLTCYMTLAQWSKLRCDH